MATILVIDDDTGVRRLVRLALERDGHSVIEARDGSEGMTMYRTAPVDLVITDLYMPGQDGIETIQQLRDEFPQSRILAISGGAVKPEHEPLRDAQLLGANATLAKPFTVESLASTIHALLNPHG